MTIKELLDSYGGQGLMLDEPEFYEFNIWTMHNDNNNFSIKDYLLFDENKHSITQFNERRFNLYANKKISNFRVCEIKQCGLIYKVKFDVVIIE